MFISCIISNKYILYIILGTFLVVMTLGCDKLICLSPFVFLVLCTVAVAALRSCKHGCRKFESSKMLLNSFKSHFIFCLCWLGQWVAAVQRLNLVRMKIISGDLTVSSPHVIVVPEHMLVLTQTLLKWKHGSFFWSCETDHGNVVLRQTKSEKPCLM